MQEQNENLLNVEFPLNPENLLEKTQFACRSQLITKAICKMTPGKAAGPSGIVAEMLKLLTDVIDEMHFYFR